MLIAIDRGSFNYILKYNSITISKSQILDLSHEILETEIKLNSSFIVSEFERILPIFELDHEVLILEIQKSKLEFDGEINLPFNSILKVYPLTGKAKNLLSGKLNQSIEISEAIFEGVIEQVKLIRSINNRKLLYNKLSKICLIQENPNHVFTQNVQSIVELLLKNQSAGNSYLANLTQYNYSPNEISSGNIEFLEKIGIIAWITSTSRSEGYTNSNYFKCCEEFKSKINEGNYATGYKSYLDIIENLSSEFKSSHDKINEINNKGQIGLDMFKVSYYFLALKTKLNKNNSNLLELFEDLIRDIHSDRVTMTHVLYLIAFSFSFEQLYESIHIIEKSSSLKPLYFIKEPQTIFDELDNEKIKQIKDEEERLAKEKAEQERIEQEERLKAEEQERIEQEERLKAEEQERIEREERLKAEEQERIEQEEPLKVVEQERIRIEEEEEEKLKVEEEKELENERVKILTKSHKKVNDMESSSDSNLSENKNEEIEIRKTIELTLFDNSEIVNVDDSTKNENEGSDQQEISTEVSEPSSEYQYSDNNELDNNSQKKEYKKSVDSNSSTIGMIEDELKINEINITEPIDTPKKQKSSKKTLQKKINEPAAASDISEIPSLEENIIENQKQESNVEQNTIDVNRVITVQIFEDEFILPNYKDNKEKFDLWDEMMGKFFPIKTESVTLRNIISQIKLRKATKEGLLNTSEEMERITNFFDQ